MTAFPEAPRSQDPEQPLLPARRRKHGVTPLPKAQLTALLVVQFPEPIIATVIYPFISELVNQVATGGDERKVGFYAGLVESLFFLTEFMFILQWGRLSDRIGRRPVLLTGLVGLTLSMLFFGVSMTFWGLVASRAIAGALCGNIGVAKAALSEIMDETNMAQGFAFLPIIWAIGATIGPFIGGYFSRPADRFPGLFGNSDFLKTYPYFLPCFISAMSAVVAFAIAFVVLEETLPSLTTHKSLPSTPTTPTKEEEAFIHDPVPSYHTIDIEPSPPLPPPPPPSVPLFSLLTPRTVIAILNYGLLALLDISFFALQPIFFASPVAVGGLGLDPVTIGILLGSYGLLNGIVQMCWFARIHASWGTKKIFVAGILAFFPLIIAFPLMNVLAAHPSASMRNLVWPLVALQYVLCCIVSMAFTCSFIFITASAASRDVLGSTNGLAQTTASFMRAIGPAGATSLFALSVESDNWMVYWVLLLVSAVSLGVSALLPAKTRATEGEEDEE